MHLSMLLETGIFASQAIWLWRRRHIRREAKKVGQTYDDYVAENSSKKIPKSDSSEIVVDVEAAHGSVSDDEEKEKTNAESAEKSESVFDAKDTAVEPPAEQRGFKQKWRTLVLRPVSEAQA